MTGLSTLCYIEKDGKYLMLHRTVKKNDVNKDKWIGVGGHFEVDESPEECLLREVKEETGYTLTSYQYRGIVTFVSGGGVTEYMSLFTADGFEGEPISCDEGELEWVDIEEVWHLNIWEGDKIFFRLLDEQKEFFSLKLTYDGGDKLVAAALNGKPMELFDVLDENGNKTGMTKERGVAHREGSPHATVHMWVVREKETENMAEIMMSCFKSGVPAKIPIRGVTIYLPQDMWRQAQSFWNPQSVKWVKNWDLLSRQKIFIMSVFITRHSKQSSMVGCSVIKNSAVSMSIRSR